MPSNQGVPVGYIQVRSVRNQHGQRVVNIPKVFCHELGIQPGDYLEFTRYSDGSIRIRRYDGTAPGLVTALRSARPT